MQWFDGGPSPPLELHLPRPQQKGQHRVHQVNQRREGHQIQVEHAASPDFEARVGLQLQKQCILAYRPEPSALQVVVPSGHPIDGVHVVFDVVVL